jgi:hypothetical protein
VFVVLIIALVSQFPVVLRPGLPCFARGIPYEEIGKGNPPNLMIHRLETLLSSTG